MTNAHASGPAPHPPGGPAAASGEPPRQSYALWAAALDYPGADWPLVLAACRAAAAPGSDLAAFVSAVESTPLGALRESYTAAFDLRPETSLGLGFHLFGDDYARSELLVRLREILRARDFSPGTELPDHACVLLRFLDHAAGGEAAAEADVLAADCLAPGLARVAAPLEKAGHPYRFLLRAILAALPAPGFDPARTEAGVLPVLP